MGICWNVSMAWCLKIIERRTGFCLYAYLCCYFHRRWKKNRNKTKDNVECPLGALLLPACNANAFYLFPSRSRVPSPDGMPHLFVCIHTIAMMDARYDALQRALNRVLHAGNGAMDCTEKNKTWAHSANVCAVCGSYGALTINQQSSRVTLHGQCPSWCDASERVCVCIKHGLCALHTTLNIMILFKWIEIDEDLAGCALASSMK